MPQVPQFELLVWVLTQVPLHDVCPDGQLQMPPLQVFPPVHALPQLPQFELLVCVLTQVPLQRVPPLGQAQAPFEQSWPVAQTFPQVPQFEVSVWRVTQEFPHLVVPPPQLTVHAPAEQT